MTEAAVAARDPWKALHWIARINILLGLFIWSRVVFELIELHAHSGRKWWFFQIALTIDVAMGALSLLSGALLLRRHSKALLVAAVAGGAIYANALFGLVLTFPPLLARLFEFAYLSRTASLGSHFVQSALLLFYWIAVLGILQGFLKHRRLEEVYDSRGRSSVLTCFATAASSMATVQILLRLFS